MSDYDWNAGEAEDDLVVPQQLAIAAYSNPKGDIVIRQQADALETDDHFIVIHRSHLRALIVKLEKLAKEGGV